MRAHRGRYHEVLKTALRLFRHKGYHATSMQDIADAVGLKKPSLYHYVKSKQDLLLPAYRHVVSRYTERLEAIASGPGSAQEKLGRAIASHVQVIIEHADMFAVYLSELRSLPASHRQAVRQASREYRLRLESIIRQGIETGEFRPVDPHLASLIILGACNWLPQWYVPGGRMSPKEIAGMYLEVLLQGLLAPDPARRQGEPAQPGVTVARRRPEDARRGMHQADFGSGDFAAGVQDRPGAQGGRGGRGVDGHRAV
ncbi:MAG: TetR/AcrR family transcriptional regulator [Firmicutes bacterium]|nr:TetR/AcrR family transcriptional regulator [Bacillota bacterium]